MLSSQMSLFSVGMTYFIKIIRIYVFGIMKSPKCVKSRGTTSLRSKCGGRFSGWLLSLVVLPSSSCMTAAKYRIFLDRILQGLIADFPANVRLNLGLNYVGSPPYCGMILNAHLRHLLGINRVSVFNWFPNQNARVIYGCLISFCGRRFSNILCMLRLQRLKCIALKNSYRETYVVFDRVWHPMFHGCNACIASDGGFFKYLLYLVKYN